MSDGNVFKTEFGASIPPDDPESLFHDLKARSAEIRHLWSHQADVLRSYHDQHEGSPDVAIQLPTGAGKTLVGLLIAEYRRRKFEERVVYLCPTRQLAKQAGSRAVSYGISAHVFVGRQAEYPADKYSEYTRGLSVAVTTYSGLFNINPRICDPHVIVLDDAHAAENFISSPWSVEIRRDADKELLLAIVDTFADLLPESLVRRLKSEDVPPYEQRYVDLVPGLHFRARLDAFRELVSSRVPEGDPNWYSWQVIRDHLQSANLFISWQSALLRPFVPPTLTHLPFANARQRIYMSATLGAGGELERIAGIERIERIPVPPGWEKRGFGRRLFLLPGLSLGAEDTLEVVANEVKSVGRALVLTPEGLTGFTARNLFASRAISVLGPEHIEDSLTPFTDASNAALVLSNRYDGLDLPDDACRLLVLWGLPCGVNLQESFLLSRLSATSFLRDRILTRLTQASGRCTRSDQDYSVVILFGDRLVDFILKSENRGLLHPELQAEIEFGVENSRTKAHTDFRSLVRQFLDQGDEWKAAEVALRALRDRKVIAEDPTARQLSKTVSLEVRYLYSLWRTDFLTATELGRAVTDSLSGDETKPYRGWWYYLTGDAALQAYSLSHDPDLLAVARDQFERASKCSLSISWFAELARLKVEGRQIAKSDLLLPLATEAVARRLMSLGAHGGRFDLAMDTMAKQLDSNDHNTFQMGVRLLGALLGFESSIPGGNADPDCLWTLSNLLCIAHEVKTEQSPADPIGAETMRQAAGHINWVRAALPLVPGTRIISLLETARGMLSPDAIPHADDVLLVHPTVLRQLGADVNSALRTLRAASTELGNEVMLDRIADTMAQKGLDPEGLVKRFSTHPARGPVSN